MTVQDNGASPETNDQIPLKMGRTEFIAMSALMISLVALSIDAMLPVLPQIGHSLGNTDPNDAQWIIGALFLGLGAGQILYGPLSDVFGRKPLIFIGLVIFASGSFISGNSEDFQTMLLGRLLQGLGVAGPRIVMIAMIRDRFSGREMAQVMSFIMAVFILVPAIAPSIGQGISFIADWRAIFWFFICLSAVNILWFSIRQVESLPKVQRSPLSLKNMASGCAEAAKNRTTLFYMLATGMVFTPFVAYLSMAPQVFQQDYALGDWFPLHFALLALAIGGASIVNSKLVMKFGMRRICRVALAFAMSCAGGFALVTVFSDRPPSLISITIVLYLIFFCMGLLFGNLNALAMEPMGHIAGLAAAFIGFGSTLISVALSPIISQTYTGSPVPLIAGFSLFCALSLSASYLADKETRPTQLKTE